MICLTGDVHQRSYRGTDTPFSPCTEVELANKYAKIAGRYGIRVTLFVTGKACLEEPKGVNAIAQMPHCEIGGHTFAAFRDPWSRIYRKLLRTPWGNASHQIRDIAKTIESIQAVTGKRISVWRNHSYIQTVETPRLLASAGISWVTDDVNPMKRSWEPLFQDIHSLPINVQPDHEYLLHGKYQVGKAKPIKLIGRVSIAEWIKQVKSEVQAIVDDRGIATMLVHPLCMEVADGMAGFEALCRFLQPFPNCWVSSVDTKGTT
ncbi:MAG: polysaccharide deacetylase family protein [Nitrospirales bacterium]